MASSHAADLGSASQISVMGLLGSRVAVSMQTIGKDQRHCMEVSIVLRRFLCALHFC